MNWVVVAVIILVFLLLGLIWYQVKKERLKQKADEFIAMYNTMRSEVWSNEYFEYEFKSEYYNVTLANYDFKSFWLYVRESALDIQKDYFRLKAMMGSFFVGEDDILEDYMNTVKEVLNQARIELWRNGWN